MTTPAVPAAEPVASAAPFPVILAGGASRRFGSDKALARVGGVAVIERVVAAIVAAGLGPPGLVADRPERFPHLDLAVRVDRHPGRGPLAGVECALEWALELGRPGALCVACDLPFLPPALLAELARHPEAEALVPESHGRRGFEPLCAYYSSSLLPAVRRGLGAGDGSLASLLAEAELHRLPLTRVAELGDPDEIFLNLNTPADLARAEAIAARFHAR